MLFKPLLSQISLERYTLSLVHAWEGLSETLKAMFLVLSPCVFRSLKLLQKWRSSRADVFSNLYVRLASMYGHIIDDVLPQTSQFVFFFIFVMLIKPVIK
ncbi:hypothetical protein ACB092_06G185800 [Castanea dentata]